MRWAATAGFMLLALIAAQAVRPMRAGAAQADASGVLTTFTVTGSQRFSPSQIQAAAQLRSGQTVTKDDLQAAADRLAASGAFSKVGFRYSTIGKNVTAEYQVADAATVPILFDNFPWFTDEELTASLKESVPLFDVQLPENGTVLDETASALEKLLSTRQVSGSVAHSLVAEPGSDTYVQQFRLDGPSLTMEAVEFSDPLARNDVAVKQSLTDVVGKPYSRAVIKRYDFEQVRPLYLSHARLRVHFGMPVARFTGNPNQPLKNSVTVIVPVEPGPEYRFAGMQWNGNAAMSNADLDAIVELKAGDIADGMKIEATWVRVSDAYANRGYLDAKIDPAANLDDAAKKAAYHVRITEGVQYHMGALVLSGLTIDGEKRIRAAWTLQPGAVFDASYAYEFIAHGAKAAFGTIPFNYDRIGHFLQKDPQSAKVDVLMDFQ